jgi:hypothetical protein
MDDVSKLNSMLSEHENAIVDRESALQVTQDLLDQTREDWLVSRPNIRSLSATLHFAHTGPR